jgi:two-component system NarL family sensor kinase
LLAILQRKINMEFKGLLLFLLLCIASACASVNAQTIIADSLLNVLKNDGISAEQKYRINFKLAELYTESEPKKALPYIDEALKLARDINNKVELGFVYHQRANYHEKTGHFDDGLQDIAQALQYADETKEGSKLFILCNATKGLILRRQSKYEEAVKALLSANAKAEEIKNDTFLYSTLTQLGILSVTMKNLDRAKDYHTQAIEIAKRLNSNRKIAKSYGNIGILFREQENYPEGIAYNEKALEYAYKSGDSSAISYALSEMGTMYDRAKQSEKATPYLLQSIAIRERNNEQNELAYSYFYLGSNQSKLGKVAESEEWIRKGFAQASKIKNTKQVIDAFQMMYINFDRNKKPDSALAYLRKFVKMRDSLSNAEVKEKIEELNIKYETQKKDLKIKDEKIKNTYLLAGIGLLLLSLALLYSVLVRRKLKYKNHLQETLIQEQNKSTKAIIEAEENERQRIASDLHDGVGQYMTAAKMNLESLSDKLNFTNETDALTFKNAIGLVADSVGEVRSISHNMMPNALLKNGLGIAVRSFLDSINQQKLKVQLFTDGLNTPIDTNTEIFLYRIIQECVNNVLKHADASELNISILIDHQELDVTIEDNGKGFDITNLSEKAGIGISNIQKRIQFLKGEIHWDSVAGKGTTVVMNVPMN